ncbi:hypothetical protein [Cryobacterium arcticum]|uniref:Uncharacterized protein n=1 Tax=Cryobacterium arcticum TaxID=670052 RepID=A0A1B1BFD5_9MICO|nr:hypothetical protein [Cryobacterium arcticum]ANP71290.1 hypothetical protein PA27867_0316 [Cryobacterium arcticum]
MPPTADQSEPRVRMRRPHPGHRMARPGRPRRSPRAHRAPVLALTVGALAAALLGASAAGGTGAFLTARASTPAAPTVITSGTAALTLTALTLPGTALYPGLTLYGAVTATNTGDVPLLLGVAGLTPPSVATASNALSQALSVGLGAADSSAACTAGTATPTWRGSFAQAPAGLLGVTLAVGASRTLCVSVSLPASAPASSQGQSATGFALRVTGTQA